jgi:hypothetical protein
MILNTNSCTNTFVKIFCLIRKKSFHRLLKNIFLVVKKLVLQEDQILNPEKLLSKPPRDKKSAL